ncbi:CIDE-N domain protein [Betabaculovirus altermyunipunctae]|uniref:CIDE-N domain protein n=1 Tax=Betabaculovirus altermyunipunctae TaxID=3051996 RepID=A0A1S5YE57_9BBAC|nr:CIDE-N domain protein [Betabaculovirus altermyunipunctae]AQQ80305.1 CIDE-N domain protein [Betabaculovirus altermyunipunctae]
MVARPFKVFNFEKQTGVMASTLDELRAAIRQVFNVTDQVIPCLADGTRIETEDYFQSLPNNERISYFVVYHVDDQQYLCYDNFCQQDYDDTLRYLDELLRNKVYSE